MTFAINRQGLLVGLSVFFLTACATPPPKSQFPQLTFVHLPSIKLDAGSLRIVDDFRSAGRLDVSQGMPVPPIVAVHQWANDRLVPAGNRGQIVVTITEASVIETELERTRGLRGAVTADQSERYYGRLAVTVEVRDPQAQRGGKVSAVATRTRTVAENVSLNQRDKMWFEFTESMMQDLDRELEKAINQFLQPFILR